ncbi:peroxisomal biogenesis factor 2 Pex2 [Heterobasidion irregulare TC 32-1]|uniref:RING-type E3 ubiquitin transferase (cysteine targeting) n=1 Tax=Heterobasidion irregulare (strain TC 32-1) TaxID=747525 RepID=W4KFQ6_HETIT|nr:peroxisomal biogenesis factor 2 Pex2 [Heterobasidion irregulare TC 32-1]ETW83876.1 peroxisomal biogenesis factor 2 Pex2 [Heterobasidion irregulare TC 32-1]
MSHRTPWQQAWDQAQPRLSSLRDSLPSSAIPPRILRVGQLDAELLDQELVHILLEPVNKALALIHTTLRSRFEPELSLLIQLTLYKLSVWNTGASYGAKLQDLTYRAPRSTSYSLTSSGLPRRILFVHGTLTILVPYLHTRIRGHALSRAWPDAPSSDKRRKAWEVLTKLETTHAILALSSFLAFLWDGKYRTIVDRLLGMRLVPARRLVKRDVSYEFMNRQMVWHAFTEFLIFLLPILPHRALRRALNTTLTAIAHPLTTLPNVLPKRATALLGLATVPDVDPSHRSSPKRGKYWNLPESECAVCTENAALNLDLADPANAIAQVGAFASASHSTYTPATSSAPEGVQEPSTHPLNTPYRASCGHTYCYVCIADRMVYAADEGRGPWECLRCAEPVQGAERLQIGDNAGYSTSGEEGEGSVEEYGSDYFDELGSSVSGVSGMGTSIGSRSWVSGSDDSD